MSLSILTLVLNVYALAAIVSRTFTFGLTPNRQAVLGWNTITMVMIVVALVRLLRASDADWIDSFRESIALLMPPAFFWALWLTFALPYF